MPATRNQASAEIRVIRRSVAAIEKALDRLRPLLRGAAERPAGGTGRRLRLSPQRKATLKLQGEYMGHLRHLGIRHQAQVKQLKAKRGFAAAIALARRLKRR